MSLSWAENEVGSADFGDKRLTNRFIKILKALLERPTTSLAAAFDEWNDVKAVYRFFGNEKVETDEIYATHRQSTIHRAQEHATILALQDTTTFHFSPQKAVNLGSIGKDGSFGFHLHTSLGVTTDGVPLGVLGRKSWARGSKQDPTKKSMRSNRPIEQKENYCWLEVMEQAALDFPSGTRVVMVGDRESDFYDLFAFADRSHFDFLIRVTHDRRLTSNKLSLKQEINQAPVLGKIQIAIPAAKGRKERTANVVLRTTTVSLPSPQYRQKENEPELTVSIISAEETGAPEGVSSLKWVLVTSLSCETFEDAMRFVTWYSHRWRIERYHYLLKSGCTVEDLQLETCERLEKAIAVYSIVAWRLLWLTYQSRETPDESCEIALSKDEWKALYVAIHRTHDIPNEPPNLAIATLWIAKLGGFLGRKRDGNPGAKVLWRGFQRLQDLTLMWRTFSRS